MLGGWYGKPGFFAKLFIINQGLVIAVKDEIFKPGIHLQSPVETIFLRIEDFNTAKRIEFTADINSIDTNNQQRDTHLKSADFFDAATYGQIRFVGRKFESDGDEAILDGDLTIRGVTKPLTVKVELGGTVTDPYGQHKAGFTVTGKISRKEFGLTWNAVTEAGHVVVSDEIKLHAEIQLVRQQEAAVATGETASAASRS